MGKPVGVEIAKCPSCGKPVGDQHPYTWCSECGKPLPEQIKVLFKPRPQDPRKGLNWSTKPRSLLWKFAASLIWATICVSSFALFFYLAYKDAESAANKDQAAFDLAQTTQKAIPIGTIVLIGGIVYLCKRPKLNHRDQQPGSQG